MLEGVFAIIFAATNSWFSAHKYKKYARSNMSILKDTNTMCCLVTQWKQEQGCSTNTQIQKQKYTSASTSKELVVSCSSNEWRTRSSLSAATMDPGVCCAQLLYTQVQNYKNTKIQKYKNTKIRKYRCTSAPAVLHVLEEECACMLECLMHNIRKS